MKKKEIALEKTPEKIAPRVKTKAEVAKILKTQIAKLNDKYGKNGNTIRMASDYYNETIAIPTGFVDVDKASGINGIPSSGILEIYGPESVGKSYLAQHIVANAQKSDVRSCVYADLEGGLELKNMANIGVNVDELVRIDFDIAETIFEQVKTLIKSGAVSTVVIDSIAALHPQMDANADYQDTVMASKARLLSRVLPEFAMLSKQYNVLIIFINQLRFKIGTYGTPEDTPGGKSLKYFAHMRIECRYYSNKEAGLQMKILDSHGDMIGQRVLVKFVKNKFAPPHREGMFELYFAAPDMVRNVIFAAKKQKLWFIRAGVHKYTRGDNEPITADSEENFVKALIVNDCVQELAEKLIAKSSELKENVLPDKFDADELLKKIDEYKEQIFNEEESKTEIYEEQFEDFGDVIKDKE